MLKIPDLWGFKGGSLFHNVVLVTIFGMSVYNKEVQENKDEPEGAIAGLWAGNDTGARHGVQLAESLSADPSGCPLLYSNTVLHILGGKRQRLPCGKRQQRWGSGKCTMNTKKIC